MVNPKCSSGSVPSKVSLKPFRHGIVNTRGGLRGGFKGGLQGGLQGGASRGGFKGGA